MGKIEDGEERLKTYTPPFITLENKILFIYVTIFITLDIIINFYKTILNKKNVLRNATSKQFTVKIARKNNFVQVFYK